MTTIDGSDIENMVREVEKLDLSSAFVIAEYLAERQRLAMECRRQLHKVQQVRRRGLTPPAPRAR